MSSVPTIEEAMDPDQLTLDKPASLSCRLAEALEVRPTPFHWRAAELNGQNAWTPVQGWTLARFYASPLVEFQALASSAGLIDLSWLRTYRLQGPELMAMLRRLTARGDQLSQPNTSVFAPCLDEYGLLTGLARLTRLEGDAVYVTSSAPFGVWLEKAALGFEVTVSALRETRGILAIAGPRAPALFSSFAQALGARADASSNPTKAVALPNKSSEDAAFLTLGEGLYGPQLEWHGPADKAISAWDRALAIGEAGEAGALLPIGQIAAMAYRLFLQRPLPGADFSPAGPGGFHGLPGTPPLARPQDLNLALPPAANHYFCGSRARLEGVEGARLMGLRMDAARESEIAVGTVVLQDEEPVGRITSVCALGEGAGAPLAPVFALARIAAQAAISGQKVTLAGPFDARDARLIGRPLR